MDVLKDLLIGNLFGPHTPMDYDMLVALLVLSFLAMRPLLTGGGE